MACSLGHCCRYLDLAASEQAIFARLSVRSGEDNFEEDDRVTVSISVS
jgi:hypothetical protein